VVPDDYHSLANLLTATYSSTAGTLGCAALQKIQVKKRCFIRLIARCVEAHLCQAKQLRGQDEETERAYVFSSTMP
jgi:hypothetical protein